MFTIYIHTYVININKLRKIFNCTHFTTPELT